MPMTAEAPTRQWVANSPAPQGQQPEIVAQLRLPDAAQTRELIGLVARVAAREGFTQEDIGEALEHALRDPETALQWFRNVVGSRARG